MQRRCNKMKFKALLVVISTCVIPMIILYHKLLSECRWNDTPNDLDQDDLTVVGESQFVQQNPVVVSQKNTIGQQNLSYPEKWIKRNKDGTLQVKEMGTKEKYIVNSPRCKIPHILPFDDRYPLMREHFKTEHFESFDHGNNGLTVFKDGVLRFDDKVRKKYYPSWKVRMHGFYRQQYAP